MARRVTVSAISSVPLYAEEGESDERLAQRMKQYWQQQMEQVLPDKPDLIVLPEKSNVPRGLPTPRWQSFCLAYAEEIEQSIRTIARETGCYIAYSALQPMADSKWHNRTLVLDRSGSDAGLYDKNFPTIEEMEDQHVQAGSEVKPIPCDFGTVACGICFDILFEAHTRRYAACKPDLIVYSSLMHGGLLANAWACQARSHLVGAVAGVQSYMISPLGQTIATSSNYTRHLTRTINLECKVVFLDYNEQRLRDAKRKYGRAISIVDPGFQGSVLLSSESDELDVNQVIQEFELELLDAYIGRSANSRLRYL